MGKTTNSLLAADEMALEGRVDVEALRTLHLGTCDAFDLPRPTRDEIERLLNELEDMLNGVRLIQELSPRSLDHLVSYGERCSVRIMAARLNQIGVPAQTFDAWDVVSLLRFDEMNDEVSRRIAISRPASLNNVCIRWTFPDILAVGRDDGRQLRRRQASAQHDRYHQGEVLEQDRSERRGGRHRIHR